MGGVRWFEVEFEGFLEVGESFLLGGALAGDVEFEALGDEPGAFAPDGARGECSLHGLILPQNAAGVCGGGGGVRPLLRYGGGDRSSAATGLEWYCGCSHSVR